MKQNSKGKYSERSLGDIGRIRTGHHFREKVEPCPSGSVRVVQTKDFNSDNGLDYTFLTVVDLQDFKEELALQDGDIIVRSRGGAKFPAAVVSHLPFIAVPSFPILLIRIEDKRVLPEYLAWYLNQPKTQKLLQTEAMGTFIPTVSKTALSNLKISLPPLQIQKDIVTLSRLAQEEYQLLQKISAKRQGLTNRLLMQYAEEGILLPSIKSLIGPSNLAYGL